MQLVTRLWGYWIWCLDVLFLTGLVSSKYHRSMIESITALSENHPHDTYQDAIISRAVCCFFSFRMTWIRTAWWNSVDAQSWCHRIMHWHWHAEMSWKTGKPLRTGRSLAHAAASTLQALQTKGVQMRRIRSNQQRWSESCPAVSFWYLCNVSCFFWLAMDWLPQSWDMQTEFVNLCKMLKSNEKHFLINWIMDSFHLWICLCLHTGPFLWISCVEVHSHASSLVALIQRFSGHLCRTRRLFTEDGSGDSFVDHLCRRSGHIRNWTLGHWSLGLQNRWGLGEMTSFKCSLNRWSKTTLPAGGSMTLIWHDMPPR